MFPSLISSSSSIFSSRLIVCIYWLDPERGKRGARGEKKSELVRDASTLVIRSITQGRAEFLLKKLVQ